MIQLNLLPDVKAKYIATEHTKRLALLSATGVCAIALGVVLSLVGVVYGAQKSKLNSLDKNINSYSAQLQGINGLNKILTIQNQLNSLTSLHNQKPVTSRLFDFLPQITPVNVKIEKLTVKYEDSSFVINGSTESLAAINKFVDTIKFTEYTTYATNADSETNIENTETTTSEAKQRVFSSVVLASFSNSDKGSNYSITAFFDPAIFSSEYKTVILSVPKITSTRSQTEQPDLLFQENSDDENSEPEPEILP